jgi:two-component system phosphate regulon sensor histidine kinase PhoR
MFNFSQKIFLSYAAVFLMFIMLMYPFSSQIVQSITNKAMEDRADDLIEKIESAPNNDAIIRILKDLKGTIFFRMSVITDERKVLYDSRIKRLVGPRFSQEYVVNHPEVLDAFKTGLGYNEDYSDLLAQKFAYMAKSFDFHGRPYIMRIAFPYNYVAELAKDLKFYLIMIATISLLLFSLMTWLAIHYFTKPIQQIIHAIRPYQEGLETHIGEIKLAKNSSEEFQKLAQTLNSLSIKIRNHIAVITQERDVIETVLESLLEGVVAIDNHMIVTYANSKALNLMGLQRHEFIGKKFTEKHQKECYTLLSSCHENKQILEDTLQIKTDGQKAFLDLVASPTKDNKGAILVLQDQTAHHKHLEMRKDFIANASHELKTPLTIVRGFAEALHDNPELSREMCEDITAKIVRNCERMNHIILDLLTLSDVENIPDSRMQSLDLFEIIGKCSKTVRDVYPRATITQLNLNNDDLKLIGDPYLLELAFNNLVVNAAKYSKEDPEIEIGMEKINDQIKVTVKDNGIGIPQEDLEHIFERFYTVNKAHSRKLGGSGLGLSIVETIITKHFGTITVESEVGKGTVFTIMLPTTRSLR